MVWADFLEELAIGGHFAGFRHDSLVYFGGEYMHVDALGLLSMDFLVLQHLHVPLGRSGELPYHDRYFGPQLH